MTVTTRTNLATRGSASSTTNWAALPGSGGAAAITNVTGDAYEGEKHNRVTWSTATTAVNGGLTYTEPSGLAANTQYAIQVWVRASKIQTVTLRAQFRDASNAIVNTVTSAGVLLAANTWSQMTLTATSGAAVTNVVLTVEAATGGVIWGVGNTLDGDAVVIETGATVGAPFSGDTVDAAGIIYAWTGTAGASTSTATTYVPQLALVTKTDAPCDRVEITITDLTPTENTATIWRTSDGKRGAVRGARRITMVTSEVVIDYEVPLGRTVTYELEVTAGIN
ncbi:MAG: carbohydrate binding domain-containing protein, partial [Pseudonocardiaceae bacterium]